MRLAIGSPLLGATALVFGLTVLGTTGLWGHYGLRERVLSVAMCALTGAGLCVSVSVLLDRRTREIPWMRIAAVAVMLALACGGALVRRSLILDGV